MSQLSSRKQFPDQVRDVFRMTPQQSMYGVVSIFSRGTGFKLHTVQIVVKSTFNRAQRCGTLPSVSMILKLSKKIIRATRLPVKGQNHCCALLPFNEKTLFRKSAWMSFIRPLAIFEFTNILHGLRQHPNLRKKQWRHETVWWCVGVWRGWERER